MIKQYTRLIEDAATGEIIACTSQDMPFADGWEPVEVEGIAQVNHDFEIEIDEPDADFKNQTIMRARKIMEFIEIKAGAPAMKPGPPGPIRDKILALGPIKDITETGIKSELRGLMIAELAKQGLSEDDFLDKIKGRRRASIMDLTPAQVIRAHKALMNAPGQNPTGE